MPGTVTIRPLSAKLTRDTELFGKMDPYCKVILGKQQAQGQVCKNGGKHPHWDDTLILKRNNESTCHIELKEKDWLLPDGTIGECDINLNEIEDARRVLKWYNVFYQHHNIGQLLIEVTYEPDQSKLPKEVPQIIQAPLPQPVVQQENKPVQIAPQAEPVQKEPAQPAPAKVGGLLKGIIHGWKPFKGNTQPMQEKDINKLQIQEQQNQYQDGKVQESYPQSGYVLAEPSQQQMKNGGQEYQQNIWAPPITELQSSQQYPQKYPQFDTQEYPSTYNYGGYYYNPASNENQEGMGYQGNQGLTTDYRQTNQQDQYNKNVGGFDPLAVIRGSR